MTADDEQRARAWGRARPPAYDEPGEEDAAPIASAPPAVPRVVRRLPQRREATPVQAAVALTVLLLVLAALAVGLVLTH